MAVKERKIFFSMMLEIGKVLEGLIIVSTKNSFTLKRLLVVR